MNRSPILVSFSVWHAIFLREAVDRLFDMRFAWFWLLIEPIMHISFITFIMKVVRVRQVGNADVTVWVIVGLLSFFLFRRTALQVTYAVESNRPLFVYRQVKPFDTCIARASLEAFLMTIIAFSILSIVALFGHVIFPVDPLLVLEAVLCLWIFGLSYGLIASVLIVLVPEMKHVLQILMLPLYLISGVIWPVASVPLPYRKTLLINPIAHGLELIRSGFFPLYRTDPDISVAYLFAWSMGSIFLGLILHRRFSIKLVTL